MIFSTEYQQRTNIKYIKNFTTHHYNRDKHLNRNNKQRFTCASLRKEFTWLRNMCSTSVHW